MRDLISRHAAIDVLSLGKEILSRVLDDIDVIGIDREKYSWGLKLIESNIEDIKELPSAQPEYYDYSDIDVVWKYYAEEQDINLTDGAKQLKDAMWVGYRKGKQDAQPEIIYCKDCKHFHYDMPYIIQDIPVLGHEVCDFWGDGCKTSENGFCSYAERRTDEADYRKE